MKRHLPFPLCLFLLFFATLLSASEPLRIALYPYVPDLAHFEEALKQAWAAQGETREIQVVPYDYYVDPFPENLDILPTDPLYLESYLAEGRLLPLPPEMLQDQDFFPFARQAGLREGRLYGVPAMTCASFLFYRQGDQAAQEAQNAQQGPTDNGNNNGNGGNGGADYVDADFKNAD